MATSEPDEARTPQEVTSQPRHADGVPGAAAALGAGWIALITIVTAEFVLQLDGQIITVALPSLQSNLGASVTTASWVVTGFALAFGGLLLIAGRLADTLGQRRVFLTGIAVLGAGSLLAGLAPTFQVLLAGRVLQGAGSALAGPSGLALLATLFSGDRQRRAFGLYSMVSGLGASAGLILGGVLTSTLGWRWCLLINVPLAIVILWIGRTTIPADPLRRVRTHLALTSALLVTAALTALVLGLTHAAEEGWSDPWAIGALSAAALLLAVAIPLDQRGANPLLPARVLADRDRIGALVNLVLLAATLTGFVVYINQYLQATLGLEPLTAGLAVLPFALAILITTQLLNRPLEALSLPVRILIGLTLMLAAVAWLTRLDGDSTYAADVLTPITLLGIGVGIAIVPFNLFVMTTVEPGDAGIAGGLLQTALIAGGALGVAALLSPFTAGTGDPGETISTVFTITTALVTAQILITLTTWFLPRTRSTGL